MKILINLTNLSKGGGIQVGNALIKTLNADRHDFRVCVSPELLCSLGEDFQAPDNVKIIPVPRRSVFRLLIGSFPIMDRLVDEYSPDAVFTLFGPSYWRPKVRHICGFARAQYIYRDSPYFRIMRLTERLKLIAKRRIHIRSFRRDADVFITESEIISGHLRKLIPGKTVYTVSNSCNPIFEYREQWIMHRLPEFDGVTLLTVSAYYPHKNLEMIPKTAEYLRRRHPEFKFRFVATLKPESLGYGKADTPEWLLPLGSVDIRECPSLYEQCDFMFLPTLLECFSASYAEAMKMRRPILTSDLPFARDICGDAAEYFDPLSPESIGETVYALAHDPERRRQLTAAGSRRLSDFPDSRDRTERYLQILERESAAAGPHK